MEDITAKANRLLVKDKGEAFFFFMLININLGKEGATYNDLKGIIKEQLKKEGLDETELEAVDYDNLIEPFVDEIDYSDDSSTVIQNKQRIMAIIQQHRKTALRQTEQTDHSGSIRREQVQVLKKDNEPYPWLSEIKAMFSRFFPEFQTRIAWDEDAWRYVNPDNIYWADSALQLKRSGQYTEACELYFSNILRSGTITLGWAQGVFKTLAAAGDLEDALNFGYEWCIKTGYSNSLATHWVGLSEMVLNEEYFAKIPEYLGSISGNPSYSVDLLRTDLYTSPLLENMRNNKTKEE